LMINASVEWPERTLNDPVSLNLDTDASLFVNRNGDVCDAFDAFRLYGATNYHISDSAEVWWSRWLNVAALAVIEFGLSIAGGGLANGSGATILLVFAVVGVVLSPVGIAVIAALVACWFAYIWHKRYQLLEAAEAVAAAVTPHISTVL